MQRLTRLFGASTERLITQMGSQDNKAALEAVKKVRERDHFKDGTLRGVDLQQADLENAELARADLEGANLQGAHLCGVYLGVTNLRKAILQDVDLTDANMREVILIEADLSGANLQGAHVAMARLRGANLSRTSLENVNLWGSDMKGVNLDGATFNENTVLPDSTYWTLDTDMARFTDPQHPAFWRSDNRHSPAHR